MGSEGRDVAGVRMAALGCRLSREAARERLGQRPFDLLVIGGGIVGAGIAAEAARAGLAGALGDRGGLRAGTPRASSKLIPRGPRPPRLADRRPLRAGPPPRPA